MKNCHVPKKPLKNANFVWKMGFGQFVLSTNVLLFFSKKTKRQKPDFPYKIGIFKRLFRDKNVGELLNPSKGQSTYS